MVMNPQHGTIIAGEVVKRVKDLCIGDEIHYGARFHKLAKIENGKMIFASWDYDKRSYALRRNTSDLIFGAKSMQYVRIRKPF